jgi:metallo-beta-lactamase family protein
MSGYCSSHSLGGQLLQGAKEVELFNETIPVAAEVDALSGLSAHADSDDLLQFLSCQHAEKVKGVFLVHGEYDTQQAFKSRLEIKGFKNISIPVQGEKIELQNEELVLNA